MTDAAPQIHPLPADADAAAALVEQLTSRERADAGTGLHVVVVVTEAGNTGYARVRDERSTGNLSQRWLKHARRGSSPGGWSELHHPRNEQQVGAWKDANAEALDRLLIDYSKRAWKLEQEAPYAVDFPLVDLGELALDDAQ